MAAGEDDDIKNSLSSAPKEAKGRLDEQEAAVELSIRQTELEQSRKKVEALGQKIKAAESHAKIKDFFAKHLMYAMLAQLVVLNVVVILHGCGLLQFSDYLLHVYIVGTLAELIGVILVISRGLFDSDNARRKKSGKKRGKK